VAKRVCDTTNACVGCTATSQCASGQTCDPVSKSCKSPQITGLCIGGGATCSSSTAAVINGTVSLTARVDSAAALATNVTLTITTGLASFAATGAKVTTTTAAIAVGATSSGAVTLYLDPTDTTPVTVVASLAGSPSQSATVTITSTSALSSLTFDKAALQEGQSATGTVTLTASPSSAATVTLTNDDLALGTITPASVSISGGTTNGATVITFAAAPGASGTAHLHASYNGVTKDFNVAVFKVVPTSITAATPSVAPSGTDTLTITVDSAPPAGASAIVNLSATAGGTVPATATVAAGATTTTAVFTAGATTGSSTVTATAGGTSANTTITIGAVTQKVMVVRVDGVAADGTTTAVLSSAAAKVFLEERDAADGTLARTIALPTAVSGANAPLVLGGSTSSEGALSRSGDGKYVVLAGYAAAPGTSAVATTTASATNRIVGRVDAAGTIDTTTHLNAVYNCTGGPPCTGAGNVRGATSQDGSAFWVDGNNTGMNYVTLGSTGASTTLATTLVNMRATHVFGGQVYVSSQSGTFLGVSAVGTGLPTTAGQTITLLPGFPTSQAGSPTPLVMSPYGFSMFDTDATAGFDTIYLAQDTSNSGANVVNVEKWKLVSGSWGKVPFAPVLTGAAANTGARGLAAFSSGGQIRIVAATTESPSRLVTFVDDASGAPAASVIATAPTNSAYRGVALSPTP